MSFAQRVAHWTKKLELTIATVPVRDQRVGDVRRLRQLGLPSGTVMQASGLVGEWGAQHD